MPPLAPPVPLVRGILVEIRLSTHASVLIELVANTVLTIDTVHVGPSILMATLLVTSAQISHVTEVVMIAVHLMLVRTRLASASVMESVTIGETGVPSVPPSNPAIRATEVLAHSSEMWYAVSPAVG